ncbi:hypothetical protein BDZ45DRAFT_41658 [Acephala macrosclerotiorum]|nr:hypothetical protein BDZ45DRAFT_41658 [Acephala macrosclerotiorum]
MAESLEMSSMNEAINSIHDNLPVPVDPRLLQTFTVFPLLPSELRLKIWQLAILPRTLHLNHSAAVRTRIKLSPTVPPLLHTNHESRTEVITYYHLSTIGPTDGQVGYETLVVVDDNYGYIRWSEVRGNEIKMKRVKGDVMWDFLKSRNKDMTKEELWGKWDWNGERGVWDQQGRWMVEGGVGRDWREEEELADVEFARVAFKEVL